MTDVSEELKGKRILRIQNSEGFPTFERTLELKTIYQHKTTPPEDVSLMALHND